MEELDSPYHRCCAVVLVELTGCFVQLKYRHEDVAQGGSGEKVLKEEEQRFQDPILLSPLGLFSWWY